MGTVHEASHRDLEKRVAIKTLHRHFASSPEVRARFLREGQASSRIRHPNVVPATLIGSALVLTVAGARLAFAGSMHSAKGGVSTRIGVSAPHAVAAGASAALAYGNVAPPPAPIVGHQFADRRVSPDDFAVSRLTLDPPSKPSKPLRPAPVFLPSRPKLAPL